MAMPRHGLDPAASTPYHVRVCNTRNTTCTSVSYSYQRSRGYCTFMYYYVVVIVGWSISLDDKFAGCAKCAGISEPLLGTTGSNGSRRRGRRTEAGRAVQVSIDPSLSMATCTDRGGRSVMDRP